MRKILVAALACAAAMAALPAAAAGHDDATAVFDNQFPQVIMLPAGFQPEGIETGRGTSFYVGSLADGAVYRGNLRTGTGDVLVPGVPGRVAVGMEIDERNRLFVAGGTTGTARVYDPSTGDLLAEYQLVPPDSGSVVNDVVVTGAAAYFTDSRKPFLYVVPIGQGGELAEPEAAHALALTGDMHYMDGGEGLCPAAPGLNANGIAASPDGRTLILGQTNTGLLFSVEPATGATSTIDLDGSTVDCSDGLLRRGHTLYVVQGRTDQVAELRLDPSYASGKVRGTISDADLDHPATVAAFGPFLYAVNARFTTPPQPDTPYQVVRLPAW